MGPPWDQDRPEKLGPDSTVNCSLSSQIQVGNSVFSCFYYVYIYIYMCVRVCVCVHNYSVIFSRHALSSMLDQLTSLEWLRSKSCSVRADFACYTCPFRWKRGEKSPSPIEMTRSWIPIGLFSPLNSAHSSTVVHFVLQTRRCPGLPFRSPKKHALPNGVVVISAQILMLTGGLEVRYRM